MIKRLFLKLTLTTVCTLFFVGDNAARNTEKNNGEETKVSTTKKVSLNALVTGGVSGIGRAIVESLKARGDRVFVFDCQEQDSPAVLSLKKLGVTYILVDVSSVLSIKKGFDQLDSMLTGDGKTDHASDLHVLVNNAGIARSCPAISTSETDWDAILAVNLKGAFFCAQQALLRMIKNKPLPDQRLARGYIIAMSSIVAKNCNPGLAAYVASKAGLIALSKTFAQEYASDQILANAIAPGFIQTPLTNKYSYEAKEYIKNRIALGRFGTGKDVADLVLFLCSGHADYLTGQVFGCDGGML